jgi:hypothetical protein
MVKNADAFLVYINNEVMPTGYTQKVFCIKLANKLDCSCG